MWVRPSSAFYGAFSLDMDRSPGFGPAPADSTALFRLGFPAAPPPWGLASPAVAARRTVLQKVRGHALAALPQLVGTRFQVLFHSPPGVLFTFPSQYYALSVTKRYLALRGGPRSFRQGSTCLDVLWIPPCLPGVSGTGLSPPLAGFPKAVPLRPQVNHAVRTPQCTHCGLGSSGSARRYSRNHCCFLFLRLLRCFSSPGSPPCAIYSRRDTWSASMWVSPFRHLRITGHVLLPAAFRSLSRLSSALSAKASTVRPFCLTSHSCTWQAPSAGIALPAVCRAFSFSQLQAFLYVCSRFH